MKINYLRFHCDSKKVSMISVMKLIFLLLLIGSTQLYAGFNLISKTMVFPTDNLVPDNQQGIKISGIVHDATSKEVLIGVTVVVEGSTLGALTDLNGKFNLTVPSASSVLNISYIGYSPVRIPLNGQVFVDVVLTATTLSLEEVVIVGYGTQKKATVTGAISSIPQATLLQSPTANVSNSLIGRMTGVMAQQTTGLPGSDQDVIRIRGAGTFTGSTDPLVMVDGIETANYNNIDPNEIESISILKDASATAVYGVRGANGVLIITTKRGTLSKPQISFSSQYATSRFTDLLHQWTGADYAINYNLARAYDSYITGGYTPVFSAAAIDHYKAQDDPVFYPSVDWYNYMFNKSTGQSQDNINISGGTDKVKYFVSAGYFNQEGLINNTNIVKEYNANPSYKRYNIRSNFDFNITKRFTASVNLSTQIENRGGMNPTDLTRVFQTCWSGNPVDHPLPENVGNRYVSLDGALTVVNPIYFMFGSGFYKDYRNYLNSSLRFNYLFDFITKGLSAHATLSYNNFYDHNITYKRNIVEYKAKRLPDNSIVYIPLSDPQPFDFSESFGKNRKAYLEAGVDYARKFGDHNVTAMILYNQSKLYDPNLAYLVAHGYQGLVGRATYDYKSRYLAEFNMGYNGTENFAIGKRFGFFPAYSIGWVTSEEPFFPKNNIVTYLKIRGTYGVVGNDQIGGNRFLYRSGVYTYTSNYYYFGQYGSNLQGYQGSIEGALGNPGLTWERAKKSNVGAEISLLKSKIKISADYFVEHRDNILANFQTIPMIFAATLPPSNMGKMKNSGYEVEIAFNNNIGKFTYWVKGNLTYAHNVIQYQNEITQPYPYQQRTGQRSGQMFGFVTEGYFNSWKEVNDANRPFYTYSNNSIQPGDIKIVDVNGDGKINSDDVVPIGYANFPEKIFGMSFGGNFKGFDFTILFQGAANVSAGLSGSYTAPFAVAANGPTFMDASWSQSRYDAGLPINFPRLNVASVATSNHQTSDQTIRDASYLRLKTAELGYSLPERWLKKVGMTNLRVYVNGSNLITWDKLPPGIDPESAGASTNNTDPYPVAKTINFGFNVKF